MSVITEYSSDLIGKLIDNKDIILKVTGVSILTLSVVYVGKICYSYRFFKKRGIKTPEYKFFWGNMPEIRRNNYSDQLRKWTQMLGITYGYYEGHFPVLVTSDIEIIQEVFIKQFGNFSARKRFPIQFSDDNPDLNMVMSTKGRWKRMRNILGPTFSPVKLKELLPLMKMCSDRFLVICESHVDKEFIISEAIRNFTMDTLANSVFGMTCDMQNNPRDPFFDNVMKFIQSFRKFNLIQFSNIFLYELRPIILPILADVLWLLSRIGIEMGSPFFWLQRNVHSIVDKRLKSTEKSRRDYVQILIEAMTTDVIDDNLATTEKLDFSEIRLQKKLTPREINMNLVQFLFAGFETTTTALNYIFYVLTKHPDEMIRLQEEIDSVFAQENSVEPTYENIVSLEYLDLFIKEVLRMYPLGNIFVNRRCTRATKVRNLDIPVGLVIAVDVLSLHFNPEYWGDTCPRTFYPSRFASTGSQINPLAYMPFGLGPRSCIGMKFALLEIKLTLIKVLLSYNIEKCPSTEIELQILENFPLRAPANGIPVLITKRDK